MTHGLTLPFPDEEARLQRLEQEVQLSSKQRHEILRSIAEVAFHPIGPDPVHPERRIAETYSRFAALMVNLSVQTDAQFAENMKVQKKLVRVTWGLLWITVALLILTAFLAVKEYLPTHQ